MKSNIRRVTKTKIAISLDSKLLKRIDSERNLVPRSRYVEHKLKCAMTR